MTILAHGNEVITTVDPGSYLGSPMYAVIPEHVIAFLFLAVAPLALLWVNQRSHRHLACGERCWYRRYEALDVQRRFVLWLVSTSALIHLGLVLGHEPSPYTVAYLVGTGLLGWLSYRLLQGTAPERASRWILLGSILAYAASSIAGEAPDQLGLLTKLIEITAYATLVLSAGGGSIRAWMRSGAVVGLLIVTATGGWIGAMASGDGGHHLGETPPPGVLLPGGEDRDPTAAEEARALHLYEETVAALDKYSDPAVAAAAGYDVEGMFGTDFHATNEAMKQDGRMLDPEYPETLVYAMAGDTPVLLGAMFEMDEIGQAGPRVGGPLTVWHAHDHVCLGVFPPGIVGLQSPFGSCPAGAINIPITHEMLHIWTLPGVAEPFGDIDEQWLGEYLASVSD